MVGFFTGTIVLLGPVGWLTSSVRARGDLLRGDGGVLGHVDGDGGDLAAVPTTTVPADRLADGIEVVDLLVLGDLVASRGAARRLIQQGGVYLGDQRVEAADLRVSGDQLRAGGLFLRAGKKRFHRFVVAE